MIPTSIQRGFTLIEVAIVLVIASLFIVAAMVFTRATDESYRTTAQSADITFNTRRALETLSNELRHTDLTHLTITTTNPLFDLVEVQLPLKVTAGTVVWGADGTSGWKVRYLVENGALIRRVVTATGTIAQMDRVLADGVDPSAAEGKCFSVSRTGSLLTISVRVVGQRDGRSWARQLTTAVSLRN